MKNQYISKEEFESVMDKLSENMVWQRKIFEDIYLEGLSIKQSINKSFVNAGYKNLRSAYRSLEKMLKTKSNGLMLMRDLRKAYLLNNPHLIYDRIKKYPKKTIPARIRWMVLTRDGFRCVACGVTSKETTLHVDHIIPYCKTKNNTDINNLQTLCALCNMGKGNIYPEHRIEKNTV